MKTKIGKIVIIALLIINILINIVIPNFSNGVNIEDKQNIGNNISVTNNENELYNVKQDVEQEKLTKENSQEFYLDSIGMRIYIDNNLIEIISGLENGDERLKDIENKEEYLNLFNNNGVLLDAVDKLGNEATREIMVMETTNANYILMENLNSMDENKVQMYFQSFVNSINNTLQNTSNANTNTENSTQQNMSQGDMQELKDGEVKITDSNLVKTENGNIYFHIKADSKVEGKSIKLSLYYTIMNQKLITISNRYIGSEIDEQAESNLIENISIDILERNTKLEWQIRLSNYLSIGIVILIGVVILLIRRRDKKKLDNTIEDNTIKSYKKFGGILILFWLLCIFQIIMTSIDLLGIQNLTSINFQIVTIIVQDIVILLVNLYMLIRELKVDKQTPKKLTRGLIIMCSVTIALLIIRNIYIGCTEEMIDIKNLILQTFYSIFSNVMYVIILIGYLHFSQRVKIYYGISDKIEYTTFNEFIENIKNIWKNKKSKVKIKKGEKDVSKSDKKEL